MALTKRKSLSLTERDLRDLELLRGSLPRQHALSVLVHAEIAPTASEAQVLSALLSVGLAAVEQRLAEESYAADAAERRSSDREFRAALRRRRPDWADEAE